MSFLDLFLDPVPKETIFDRQFLHRWAITSWQWAKKHLPFLNNYSHLLSQLAFKVFPPMSHEVSAELPWGGEIVLPPGSPSARIYLSGAYELEVVEKISHFFSPLPGVTAIDVGAHVGYFTRLLSQQVGPRGNVFAFEPNPISYRYLKENIQGYSGVEAVPMAVGAEAGVGYLEDVADLEHGMIKESGSHQVEIQSLDYFLNQRIERLGIIKIDTDGFETNVIRGARQLLAAHPEARLIIEHQALPVDDAFEELSGLLIDYGYNSYEIVERGSWHKLGDPFPYPVHNIVYNLYIPPRV